MAVQTLEMKPVVPVAAVLQFIRSPLKIPAWSAVVLVVLAGLYGFVAGRQNPVHHYVPYVGYPLVMDTTTGKACYSSAPKAAQAPLPGDVGYSADGVQSRMDADVTTGPAIPLCGKE
jgi:hypothetical protein